MLILAKAREQKFVPIENLLDLTESSLTTIRRDINCLADQGKIRKTRGGISYIGIVDFSDNSFNYIPREKQYQKEKEAIGRAAQRLIEDGDIIILINGTTTSQVAKHIDENKRLTIITNGIDIVSALRYKTNIEVILLGGIVNYSQNVVAGPTIIKMLAEINPSKMITGMGGITEEKGGTIYDFVGSSDFKEIVDRVQDVIVVADHSKFGRNVLVQGAPLSKITTVITDKEISPEFIEVFKRHNINYNLA